MGNSLPSMGKLIRQQLGKQRTWRGYAPCGLLEAPYWWFLKPTAVSKIGWTAKALQMMNRVSASQPVLFLQN